MCQTMCQVLNHHNNESTIQQPILYRNNFALLFGTRYGGIISMTPASRIRHDSLILVLKSKKYQNVMDYVKKTV